MASIADAKIVVNDSTLRDGEQAPGVSFNPAEKAAIALALERAGVDEIEAGVPAMGHLEVESMRGVQRVLSRARAVSWCRMKEQDVEAAKATGITHVHLSVPVSDRQIAVKRAGGRKAILTRVKRVLRYAQGLGLTASVGGEDASRADPEFLHQVALTAQKAGAIKFRYADTLGVLEPFGTFEIISALRSALSIDLEFHGHDDLGLATANTLAAVRGGATHVSVCVLGLGERAGNAPLEEVVTALSQLESRVTNVQPAALPQLAELVATASRRAIPAAKAIVGTAAFAHEAGIHVSGLLRDPASYEALSPELFGKSRQILLGKHSGRASVRHALKALGVSADEERLRLVLEQVRMLAVEAKRSVGEDELLRLYAGVTPPPLATGTWG
jgi:homocitrate synthase NifV